MTFRQAVIAFVLVQSLAFAASAQQAEFGRVTGGEIVATTKGATPLSGSLELSLMTGNDALGRSRSPAYGVTAGGTLLPDRLWFFASASRQKTSYARFADNTLPTTAASSAIGARLHGQLGSSHDFSAFFDSARRPELSTTGISPFATIGPSSFLSLHYTGIVSSNMFFTGSVSRSSW